MPHPLRSRRSGFALVLALALTGLVFAVVLVFAAWIQFSARTVAVGKEKAHARDLAYLALKEAIFELNDSFSDDGCLIVDCGDERLDVYLPEGGRIQNMGSNNRSWENSDAEALSCGYTIRVYEESSVVLGLPVGGLLTNSSGGFKENLKEYLRPGQEMQKGGVFGESVGVYGPSWALLGSYADLCNSLMQWDSVKPQGHGPFGAGGYIPVAVSGEAFLQTIPIVAAIHGPTERGDPVRFGVYPWLRSMDVRYGIEVERSEIYYTARIVEHVSVQLYNPYDVPLELADYEVRVSGAMPDLAMRVGGGNSMNALLKNHWKFSAVLNATEEKEVELPARVVYEFSPMLENPNALRVGLGGALPEVKSSSAPQGSGRSLKEAFFNKRKARSQEDKSKPAGVRQVQFHLDGGEGEFLLLQRVNEASFMTFDISSPTRVATEKRVWELPHLGAIAQSGEEPLFAWNYAANGVLSNLGALLVSSGGMREEGGSAVVSLPRGLHSRMDFEVGLRSFYGTGPLVLGGQARDSFWNDSLSAALWDTYFYPLEPECYVAYSRGAKVDLPIDPQQTLLKGAFFINTLDVARWETFLARHAPLLGQADLSHLAQALCAVVEERVPLCSVVSFWGERGVFSEAIRRAGLERLELQRLKGAICEHLVLRPDTFIVRGQGIFGESEATCEAIVQRVPEGSPPSEREYRKVAFRWVQKNLSP